MTGHFPATATTKPPVLSSAEIDKLLSMTVIANLGTTDDDDSIHLMPMWFKRIGNEICIPTSYNTHKYRNLRARPRASVMIDVSKAGLNLKGVLIRGKVKLVDGKEAQQINRSIHLKYVTSEALNEPNVASYLSKGDDITMKISIDHLISWNLADSKAGQAVSAGGWYHPLEG
jgi:nitroimidazol reductase NimA-like FMN-containing flavoprotein (pyridoxamine 5'-phosphate oxidase superfamily)